MNTTALAPVTVAAERDLFGLVPVSREVRGSMIPIMSKKDATKQLGRTITFDGQTLAEYKAALAETDLTAKEKKAKRQAFLHKDAIAQRQELGRIALSLAYQPDEFAPMGRVPDVMQLRKNGTLKLVSVEGFVGKDRSETPTQKIARLERELREAKAAKDAPKAPEINADTALIEGEPAMEG